jgi:autotransporter-associated beta strand protein
MKSTPVFLVRFAFPTLLATTLPATAVKADTYTWDADGNAAVGTPATGTPGSGTWSTAAANWNPSLSPATDVVWSNSAGDTAQFGAAGAADGTYAITVGASVTNAAKLNFQTSGFTLSSATATSVNLAGGTGAITVAGGKTATIGNNLTFALTTTSTILNDSASGAGTGTLVIGSGGKLSNTNTINLTQSSSTAQIKVQVDAGGTLAVDRVLLNSSGADDALLVVNGGTVTVASTTNPGSGLFLGSTSSSNTINRSRITLTSGSITATSGPGSSGALQYGQTSGSAASGSSAQGVFDLDGGILTVAQIKEGGSTANTDSTFNFNGGVLKVKSDTTSGATFMTGIDNANVRAGGAKIHTNGVSTTIGQILQHDAGLGGAIDGGLEKQGSGALTLSGANTYTGATTVTTGTLILDATGTFNNSSKVIVKSGAIFNVSAKTSGYTVNGLEGAGTVVGLSGQAVTVSASGTLSPGEGSVGTLTFSAGNLSLTSGATYKMDIGGTTASPTNDLVSLTGAGSTVSIAGSYILSLSNLGAVDPTGKTFVIFDSVASIASAGSWTIDYGSTGWSGGVVSLNGLDNTQVILSGLSAIPEPSTFALILGGFTLVLGIHRRRHRSNR